MGKIKDFFKNKLNTKDYVFISIVLVLIIASPGDKIFVVSYGSGAGSDGFVITVTDEIEKKRDLAPKTSEIISNKIYVDYAVYAKLKGKIKM